MILSTTKTIAQIPHLASFLADSPNVVAGWGRKPSGRQAFWLSKMLRRPLALLEDGFIRSVERGRPSLSLLIDDIGIYYDASRPSRMERTIAQGIGAREADRARALANAWRRHEISKYNHAPDFDGLLPDPYILIVDQIAGDLSISGGLADTASFVRMLQAALAENPGVAIVIKTHPDVFTKAKRGHFTSAAPHDGRVHVIGEDCHAPSLIRGASVIYCVTSLMGFEALLWNKPVRCFGMPFYAGWGITQDELRSPPRRRQVRREDVVHAALVSLARYANPVDGVRWEIEQVIDYIVKERGALALRHALHHSA
jgi:capsular polysaccharide export protein